MFPPESTDVLAHPVAFKEVKQCIDREMPTVRRTDGASGGAAAQADAQILTIYERPSRKTLGAHLYLVEVAGHPSA